MKWVIGLLLIVVGAVTNASAAVVVYEKSITTSSHATTGVETAADSLIVAASGGTAVYSGWFEISGTVFSAQQSKPVQVIPDVIRIRFSVNFASSSSGYVSVIPTLQTSDDRTTYSFETMELETIHETLTGKKIFEVMLPRTAFDVGVPYAKWARLKFLSESTEAYTTGIDDIKVVGLLNELVP